MRTVKTMKVAAATSLVAAVYPGGPAAQVEDIAAEGGMKSLQCVACHGPDGIAPNPLFPHLAGQNASYLEIQLEKFKNGERYHPLMTPVAQSLSREDIVELATYFSRIGPLAAAPNTGTEP